MCITYSVKQFCLIVLVFAFTIGQGASAQTIISTGKYTTAATLDADANIYAVQYDAANNEYDVVKYDEPGYTSSTVIYNGVIFEAEYPTDLETASNGDVYVLDGFDNSTGNGRLIMLDASNGYASSVISSGTYHTALGIDANDDIYVAEYDGSSDYHVVKYDASNGYSQTVIFSGLGINSPYSRGLTVDTDGNVYVLTNFDNNNGTIYKLTPPGYAATVVDQGGYYVGLATDGHGDLFAMAYDGANDHFDVVQYTSGSGSPTVVHSGLTYSGSSYPMGLGSNLALGDLVVPDPWNGSNGTLYYLDRTDPPLPVELAEFSAVTQGDAVALTWRTLSETNNAGFAVQRRAAASIGVEAWTEVAYVEGHGTTAQPQHYQIYDADLPFSAQRLTYRLKQIDTDGTHAYSPEVEVVQSAVNRTSLMTPYPNPTAGPSTIRYELARSTKVELVVFNALGQRVARLADSHHAAGRHEHTLPSKDLPAGIYFVRLRTEEGTTMTRQLAVVR